MEGVKDLGKGSLEFQCAGSTMNLTIPFSRSFTLYFISAH